MIHNIEIPQLTSLRFFAAFFVFLSHYSGLFKIPIEYAFLMDFFGNFVGLFFILSGFILSHNYKSAFMTNKPHNKTIFLNYLYFRLSRIYPVYLISTITTLVIYWANDFQISLGGGPEYDKKIISFFANIFAIQAWIPDVGFQQYWNAPAWSVSSEIFFYLCFPFLLNFFFSRNIKFSHLLSLSFFVISIYLISVLISDEPESNKSVMIMYAIRAPFFGILLFSMGIALNIKQNQTKKTYVTILFYLSLILSYLLKISQDHVSNGVYLSMSVLCYYILYPVFFIQLINFLVNGSGFFINILSNKFFVMLGKSSYVLYMIHWIPLSYLSHSRNINFSPLNSFLFSISIIFISLVVFLFYEDPTRKLINRFINSANHVRSDK